MHKVFPLLVCAYTNSLCAVIAYVLVQDSRIWWLIWPFFWTTLIVAFYALQEKHPMSIGFFVFRSLAVLVGMPILLAAPLYPSSIRLAFVLLVGFFAVFAAALLYEELQLTYYSFRQRLVGK